jgi:hypothetical protein
MGRLALDPRAWFLLGLAIWIGDAALYGVAHPLAAIKGLAGRVSAFVAPAREETIWEERPPLFLFTLRYPTRFIPMFRAAHRDGHDILADYGALERAWRAVSGDAALSLRFVKSPRVDPFSAWKIPPHPGESRSIDAGTFEA